MSSLTPQQRLADLDVHAVFHILERVAAGDRTPDIHPFD